MRASDSRIGLVCGLILSTLAACRVGETQAVLPEALADRDAGTMSSASPIEPNDGALDAMTPIVQRDAAAPVDANPPQTGGCSSLTDCMAPAGCEALEHEGHVYFFCTESLTWQDARQRCIAAKTDLAIVADDAENAFVSMHLSATSWIGLSDVDVEGDYRWVDPLTGASAGSSSTFTKWADTKPDNCGAGLFGEQDCVRISADGKWDDSNCQGGCTEGTFTFVCESF